MTESQPHFGASQLYTPPPVAAAQAAAHTVGPLGVTSKHDRNVVDLLESSGCPFIW